MTAEQRDTPMGDAPDEDAAVTLVLSDDETRVLALYDQLKAIQLEIALLKARQSFAGGKKVRGGVSPNQWPEKEPAYRRR